jgi:hypothetical protein
MEQRNVGEADHGTLQFLLANDSYSRRKEWSVRVYFDTGMQTQPSRFRVPDVSIAPLTSAKEQIIRTPPLLCVDVLSPEDTLRKMLASFRSTSGWASRTFGSSIRKDAPRPSVIQEAPVPNKARELFPCRNSGRHRSVREIRRLG